MDGNSNIVKSLGSIIKATPTLTQKVETYTDDEDLIVVNKAQEISVYGSTPATHEEVTIAVADLRIAFPARDEATQERFYSLLIEKIEEEGMPIERVKDAINYLIRNNKYREFRIADILNFDQCVTLAPCIADLRHKKKVELAYNDMVLVWTQTQDGRLHKMYGVRYEIENSPMRNRIIAYWDDTTHWWHYCGDISIRKRLFMQSLAIYCNNPEKGCYGEYEPSMLRAFSNYYTEVIPNTDRMRFELIWWDTEGRLKQWYKQSNKQNNETDTKNHENLRTTERGIESR